jgi:hypothetical protein
MNTLTLRRPRRRPPHREGSKMKTSTPRSLRDEDLHAEKALKMKTSAPKRLGDKDLCAKKTLEPKTFTSRRCWRRP